MDGIFEFLKQLVNPESIIRYGGLYFLLFVVFAETGLFFGFFLPGDSLIFTSGLLCATGVIDVHIFLLILFLIIASVLGNIVGYAFGKRVGHALLNRKSSFLFKKERIIAAKEFYEKHGGKAVVLCRFLPIVRTFVPIVAGIVEMGYKRYTLYNVMGAILWITSFCLAGYYLGIHVPGVKDYLGYIVIGLVTITSIPFIVKALKGRKK